MNSSTMQAKIEVLEHAFAEYAGAYYSINLTRNVVPGTMYQVIDGIEYSLNEQMGMPADAPFTDVVAYWGNRLPENEKDAYFAFFSLDNLLANFRAGNTHVSHTYWTHSAVFKPMLAEQHVVMFADSETSDVLAISYLVDQTEQFNLREHNRNAVLEKAELERVLDIERKTSAMLTALSKTYAQVFEVDLSCGTYSEIFTNDAVRSGHGGYRKGHAAADFPKAIKRFVAPEHRQRVAEFLDLSTLKQRMGSSDTITIDYLTTFGQWASSSYLVQRRNDSGDPSVMLFTVREIDEEKRRELDYQQQLQESAAAAERANEAKTDFLRRMSHDIRTPINGIIGMIDMAGKNLDNPEKVRECNEKELSAAKYLLSLVNDVLDVAKLEAGEIVVESEPFDLIPLLLDEVSIAEAYAAQNGVVFYGGKPASVIKHRYLMGSANLMNRVLMNIASNAVKYNRPGGSITLSATEIASTQNTATYRFVCADTGIGMSEEFLSRAFEPYAQEGRGSCSSFSGTGLGLAIVKNIVDQMGGTVEIESAVDVGTTVAVTITFGIDAEGPSRAQVCPTFQDSTALVAGKRALLVDDNELNREIAESLLREIGLEVTCAVNGRDAVEAFRTSRPFAYDYVFMDVMMPLMNGLDATRAIRSLDRPDASTVAVFALSANAFADDVQASLDAGMNAHLTKPLERDKILQAIVEFASR